MVEKSEFLLYQLGETPRRLEKTILSEKGIKEKYIQNFFQENLAQVFDLIFLKEEYCLTNPDTGEKDFRADTLTFNKKGFFVISNYSKKDHRVDKGNYFFSIENENDLQKIKDFFAEYKEQFSENHELFQ